MPFPNMVESIVKDELGVLLNRLQADIEDPQVRADLLAMAEDAAMLPVRVARGEDIELLLRSLSAEAQNRALTHRVRVQQAVREAWMRAITRILATVVAAL